MPSTKPVNSDTSVKNACPRRLSSKDLFGQATCVRIAHEDEEYLLRITRQGKLILTK